MLSRAVRIAAIRGVEVRLDPSLGVLALLLAWLLWTRFTPAFGTPIGGTMAVAGSLLFFASILAHELAHAFEAMHRDIEVRAITLLLFGGVTEMHAESKHPRDEFVIAAVGPYVSLVCAAVFHLVGVLTAQAVGPVAAAPVVELTLLLAYLNVLLAVFNLVPGAPLDGGRVLRAALWWLWKDRRRAVRGAARAGQAFGFLVVVFGVFEFAAGLELAALGGLWWILIGGFLFTAARAELRRDDARAALVDRTAADVLGPPPAVVAADVPVAGIGLDDDTADHVLVRSPAGTVDGWIHRDVLADLAPGDRTTVTAGQVARPLADLRAIALHEPLEDVVDRFVRGGHHVRVDDHGRTVAVLTEATTSRGLRHLDRAPARA
jgi:Zn-dependent protease